jgi:uncharacterized protein (TIGR02270 family)
MILIDILEEHIEEADFLWQQRGNALLSKNYNLDKFAELEKRLLAHLDGLVLAEKDGWKLLEPKLAGGEIGEVFAAAFVALESGDAKQIDQVQKGFLKAEDAILNGIHHALRHTNSLDVEKIVRPLLNTERNELRAAALDILSFRRVLIEPNRLQIFLGDKDPRVVFAAINAIGRLRTIQLKEQVEQLLTVSDTGVRLEALRTGLLLERKRALDESRKAIEKRSDIANEALTLVGLAGHGEDLHLLFDALSEPALTCPAITAMGLLGNLSAIEPLINFMKEPKLSRLAGEAFCLLTGVNLKKEILLVEKSTEVESKAQTRDEDDDLPNDPDEGFSYPDHDKIAAWWQKNVSQFDKKGRYRKGRLYCQQGLIDCLKIGQLPERHFAALELALINLSYPFLETSAFAHRQKKDLAIFFSSQGSSNEADV